MGISIKVSVNWLSCPQGDVVQIDDIIISATIDQCTQFAVADRQRLFEEVGRTVVLQ